MSNKKKISLSDLGVEEQSVIPAASKSGIVTPKMAKGAAAAIAEDGDDGIKVVDASEIVPTRKKDDIVAKNQQAMVDRIDASLERNKQEMLETVINPAKDKKMVADLERELSVETGNEPDPLATTNVDMREEDPLGDIVSPQEKMKAISFKAESHNESAIKGISADSLDNLTTSTLTDEDFDKLMEEATVEDETEKLSPEEKTELEEWFKQAQEKFKIDVRSKLNVGIPTGDLRVSTASVSAAKVLSRMPHKITNTATVPLIHTGRMITLSALVGDEIPKLRAEGYSSDLAAARSIFTIIYNHDTDPNKPENFQTWLKGICDWDINQLYWGLYEATFGTSNYLTYVCPECQSTFIVEKDIKDMCRLSPDCSKGAKERIDAIIKNDNVGDISRLVGGKPQAISSQYAVSIKAPSIFSTVFEPSALETQFTRKYNNLIGLASYIDRIYTIENGVAIPIETEVRDNVTKSVKMKIVALSKVVSSLSVDESARLTALVSEVLQYRNDEFKYYYPETDCTGFYGPMKDNDGKSLKGKKCTHHFEERAELEGKDGRLYPLGSLDLIFTREQLSTLANFTIES